MPEDNLNPNEVCSQETRELYSKGGWKSTRRLAIISGPFKLVTDSIRAATLPKGVFTYTAGFIPLLRTWACIVISPRATGVGVQAAW